MAAIRGTSHYATSLAGRGRRHVEKRKRVQLSKNGTSWLYRVEDQVLNVLSEVSEVLVHVAPKEELTPSKSPQIIVD